MDRISIQWTDTARSNLAQFPPDARRGLMNKANELRDTTDIATICRRLAGPLRDYHRICFSKYRAVYSISREQLPDGNCWVRITFRFATEGKRGEGARDEIQRFAQKLLSSLEVQEPPDSPKRRRKRK